MKVVSYKTVAIRRANPAPVPERPQPLVLKRCGLLRFAQVGVPAVALLGAHASARQCAMLASARQCAMLASAKLVVMMLDGDRVGRAGMWRLVEQLNGRGDVPVHLQQPPPLHPRLSQERSIPRPVRGAAASIGRTNSSALISDKGFVRAVGSPRDFNHRVAPGFAHPHGFNRRVAPGFAHPHGFNRRASPGLAQSRSSNRKVSSPPLQPPPPQATLQKQAKSAPASGHLPRVLPQ